jgi:hypothetical protein
MSLFDFASYANLNIIPLGEGSPKAGVGSSTLLGMHSAALEIQAGRNS